MLWDLRTPPPPQPPLSARWGSPSREPRRGGGVRERGSNDPPPPPARKPIFRQPLGPPMVPTEGGPKIFKLESEGAGAKFWLSASNIGSGGGGGGGSRGGTSPPPVPPLRRDGCNAPLFRVLQSPQDMGVGCGCKAAGRWGSQSAPRHRDAREGPQAERGRFKIGCQSGCWWLEKRWGGKAWRLRLGLGLGLEGALGAGRSGRDRSPEGDQTVTRKVGGLGGVSAPPSPLSACACDAETPYSTRSRAWANQFEARSGGPGQGRD